MENKETNLWDLCLRFANWIAGLCRKLCLLIADSIRLCLRKWWVSVPLVLICVGFMLYSARPSNKWYRVEGVALLNGPSITMAQQVFKPVAEALDARYSPVQTYSSLIGINDEMMSQIKNLKSHYVIDCMNDSTPDFVDWKDKNSMIDTMYMRLQDKMGISFVTHDLGATLPFADSVVAYLNRDPQMVACYEAYRRNLERESRFCRDQIERLDSLSLDFYFHQGVGDVQTQYNRATTSLLVGKREIKLFHSEILDLINYKSKVDRRLSQCTAPVVVTGGFAVNHKAQNGLLKSGIIGLVVGYLLSCLIAALIENRKALHEWLKG